MVVEKKIAFYTLLITMQLLFNSCVKDKKIVQKTDTTPSYFGLKLKRTNIFKVDSIAYNDFFSKVDTFRYEIKEFCDTTFLDNVGDLAHRIYLYKKDSDTVPWRFLRVYYAKATRQFAERIDQNLRFLKLSFPINLDALWNINQRTGLNPVWLFYTEIDKKFKGKFFQTDSILTIEADEIKNSIEEFVYLEKYSKKNGLLFSHKVDKFKRNGKFNGFDVTYELYKQY